MTHVTTKPLRILHAVGKMNQAGAETWLMHLLRRYDARDLSMDFLVFTEEKGDYDEEILARGGRLIRCLGYRNPVLYAKRLKEILRRDGPYDVVHAHQQFFNALTLTVAAAADVPVRIAHGHCTLFAGESFARQGYNAVARFLIRRYMTHGLAVSADTAADYFTSAWQSDRRISIMYPGIDIDAFLAPKNRDELRAGLGIGRDDLVLGHVGRFEDVKNHAFLLNVLHEVRRLRPDARLVLVGDGSLRQRLIDQAASLGISASVLMVGKTSDVVGMLKGVFDVFVFPSKTEGLPLALSEAQAAGLPCFISDAISTEADLVPENIVRLPLSTGASHWARTIAKGAGASVSREEALRRVEASPLNIDRMLKTLQAIYETPRASTPAKR